jgi:hypothetical protein
MAIQSDYIHSTIFLSFSNFPIVVPLLSWPVYGGRSNIASSSVSASKLMLKLPNIASAVQRSCETLTESRDSSTGGLTGSPVGEIAEWLVEASGPDSLGLGESRGDVETW